MVSLFLGSNVDVDTEFKIALSRNFHAKSMCCLTSLSFSMMRFKLNNDCHSQTSGDLWQYVTGTPKI